MESFSYKKEYTTQSSSTEDLKKKIGKQRFIFFFAFIILTISILSYFIYNSIVQTFDGYIICRNNEIRMVDDVTIFQFYVKPGDLVKEGDTLFAYFFSNWLYDYINPGVNVGPDKDINVVLHRIHQLESQLSMQKRSADSLSGIVKQVRNDLLLGVATRQMVEEKEWASFQMRGEIQHTERLIVSNKELEKALQKQAVFGENTRPLGEYTYSELSHHVDAYGASFRYRVAITNMRIVEISAKVGGLAYKKEPVITYYAYDNPELSDLHVQLLIPPQMLPQMDSSLHMDIYLGSEFLGNATASLSSSHMAEVEPFKLGLFAKEKEAVAVRMNLENPRKFRTRYQLEHLPIKLRFSKMQLLKRSIKGWFNNIGYRNDSSQEKIRKHYE